MNDLRFAFRQLLKNPGFTAVAVFTLALGIGANTAIFSVVDVLILNPVPGSHPEQLVEIAEQDRKDLERSRFYGVAPPALATLRANERLLGDLAWSYSTHLNRRTDEFVEEIMGAKVSSNFFTVLGAEPEIGRTFAPDETTPLDENDRPAGDSVIIISYSFWRSLFAGDANVVGRSLELAGHRLTVIGVMPKHFKFPHGNVQFWLAVNDPLVQPRVGEAPNYQVLTRLQAGGTREKTQGILDALTQRTIQEYGEHRMYGRDVKREGWRLRVRPLRESLTNEKLQRTFLGLLGAITFVLLIVCANIANLTLAKSEGRQQEFAVRAALGAGRCRLIGQLLTESVLLAVLGGLAGLLMTWWGIRLLVALIPSWIPLIREMAVDGHVLAFTLVTSLGAGILVGLAPVLRSSRLPLMEVLKRSEARATLGRGWRRYRSALVAIEVALTVVLLAGAGLMIQSVARLLRVKPGFDPENLLQVRVILPWEKYAYPYRPQRNLLLARLHQQLAALPGVKAVGIDKQNFSHKFWMRDRSEPIELQHAGCGVEESDPFRAMRVPLLAGRYLDRTDIANAYFHENDLTEGISAVVINETMARVCWPGGQALGKKFGSSERSKRSYEVVGIVTDVRPYSYDQNVLPTFYRPYQEFDLPGMAPAYLIRTDGDPRALIPAIRRELKAAEVDMRTPDIRPIQQILYDSTQLHRTYMFYLVALASVGLMLAALGLYGVLAYSVARRTREIGIRMALGAGRGQVLGMVMREGARLVTLGVAAGLVAAFWLTRFLRSQLFEVEPTDPLVLTCVVVLLFTVALLACLLPARRAAGTNPMDALRYE